MTSSATTDALFGARKGEPAVPGSYGQPAPGFRLPPGTGLGKVRLRVADLDVSIEYYRSVLGMRVLERDAERASLAASGDDRVLVELHEQCGASPAARRGRLGLYHFAILLPDRAALGRFVQHLAASGVEPGAADHLVSEALYLQDPDGLGIEVYADRPRESWQRVGRELMMASDPLDVDGLLRAAGRGGWNGMPAGTVVGHVHLHVGDLVQAGAFYSDALGFDRMVWSYPGALFLGADGYHHHVGTNLWAGPNARPTRADEAGLLEWTIEVPDPESIDAAAESLAAAQYESTREHGDLLTTDPWGTTVRLHGHAY